MGIYDMAMTGALIVLLVLFVLQERSWRAINASMDRTMTILAELHAALDRQIRR